MKGDYIMRKMYSKKQIEEISKGSIASASEGTIAEALGLDEDGNVVKGEISGGTKLYKHKLVYDLGSAQNNVKIALIYFCSQSTAFTSLANFIAYANPSSGNNIVVSSLYDFVNESGGSPLYYCDNNAELWIHQIADDQSFTSYPLQVNAQYREFIDEVIE